MSYRNNNNNNNNRNNSRRGGGSSHNNRRMDTSRMPLEQGIICTLRDSFGFIHCAERPQEVFFHYSEVNFNPNDLQIDTEVEFKVGIGSNSSDKKLAAYDIKPLPTGTVVWETEEQPETFFQGFVEKAARQDSRSSVEGTIRVVNKKKKKGSGVDDDGDDDDDVTTTAASAAAAGGQLIRYRNEDYQASSSRNSNSNSNRLFRGDLVQFRILMDRRTKQNYGRYIELLQTEKDRKRNEKQQKLLQTAVEEQGVVVSLNNGFGFIKSNKRRDHVYFHYSNLIIPPENEDDDFELQKGQELKFWVVTETEDDNNDNNNNNGNNGGKNKKKEKRSALNVECLPKGTVVFHSEVAKGIQGIVEICPRPPIGSDDMYGTIRLLDPVWDGEQQVKSVLLEFSDAPGGTYTYNKQQHSSSSFTNSAGGGGGNSSVMGLWIENGDTLLFDVVKELADGSYRASPTYHTIGKGGTIIEPPPLPKDEGDAVSKTTTTTTTTPVVRLCACSLVHRADGVIHTVKENSGYGFLHFSERCIDVHFKTYNFLPDELQSDLRLYLGYDGTPSPTLESGTAVQFDICAHGRVTRGRGGRQQQQQQMHDRENIKGHRMLLLPRSAVMMEKVVKTQIQGVVKSVDPKQFYSGIVQVEEDLEPMSIEERHPLVAKMIHSFLEESNNKPNGRSSLVFRDVVSVKEDEVVVEMVKLLGGGLLECTHIGMAGGGGGSSSSSHPGRLCIKRVEQEKEKDDTAVAAAEKEEGEEKEEKQQQKQQKPKHAKKNKSSMMMSVRQVHYDKSSLTDELKEDVPLGKGDVVKMDVHQCRRTGRMIVHNLTVVERNPSPDVDEVATTEGSGMGIVKEVVPKRKFGFITVLDETATKRESLFFHLPEDSKGTMYRKGDEVKFDIGLEKSGKRVALNVESLPKGSIPIKAAANACQGYILMEPTHTSLSDTPLRRKFSHMSTGGSDKSSSGGGGGGRWGDVKEDSTRRNNNNKTDLHEEGCILLLEDKTGMFKNRKMRKSKKNASDDDAKSLESFDSHDDAKSIESTDSALDDDDNKNSNEKTTNGEERGGEDLHIHLPYKNGAIAIHGSGATSSLDGSTNPRRGDLVSFVKAKKGTTSVRDVRIITRQAAKLIQGRLENIELEGGPNRGKAKFIAATEKEEVYEVDLREVVSCDVAVLKDKQAVEAVLHDGKLYGICRTSDLYLGSKLGTKMLGTKNKERPKLNLSVKKNRGGRIIAQSMMAKGPDGSIGFVNGWTTRKSKYLGETQEKTTG